MGFAQSITSQGVAFKKNEKLQYNYSSSFLLAVSSWIPLLTLLGWNKCIWINYTSDNVIEAADRETLVSCDHTAQGYHSRYT